MLGLYMIEAKTQAVGGSVSAILLFGTSQLAFLFEEEVYGRQVTAKSRTSMDLKIKVLKPAVNECQRQNPRQIWSIHDSDPKVLTLAN